MCGSINIFIDLDDFFDNYFTFKDEVETPTEEKDKEEGMQ